MASKTKTTYLLNPFDRKKAASGELCVMVKTNVLPVTADTPPAQNSISNIKLISDIWSDNTDFKGAGICIFRAPNNFILIVDNTTYTFNERGEAANIETKGWHLLMGQIDETAQATGNAVVIKTKTVIKRNINATPVEEGVQQARESPLFDGDGEGGTTGNGNDETQPDPGREIDPGAGRVIDDIATISDEVEMTEASNGNTVVVDSLNARDQFAMQALGELLGHIPDPSVLGENERNHFCNSAYAWAANMMTAAAKARATIVYTKEGTEEEDTEVSGITLNNNTEKLLNNIAAAIDNNKSGGSSSVSIPALITWLNNYSAGTTEGTTVGLKDLITAIGNISITGGSNTVNMDLSTINSAITGTVPKMNINNSGWINLDLNGLGAPNTPFNINCTYNFPGKSTLGSTQKVYKDNSTPRDLSNEYTDFFVFNSSGVPGYTSLQQVAIGIINEFTSSSAPTDITNQFKHLLAKLFAKFGQISGDSNLSSTLADLKSYIDTEISNWVSSHAKTVTINGTDYVVLKNVTPA